MDACCFSHRSRERLLAASFSPFFPKKSILVSPLSGSHRAVGDAQAALECLREMAAVYEREYAASPTEVEQS